MIEHPRLEEIREAAVRLNNVVLRTPLVPLHEDDGRRDIFLKPEILQPTQSFKIRGVFNAVNALSPEARSRGLSTVSAGNTAQALAWCGRHFGVSARSLMPEGAPTAKIEAVRSYGGQPILVPVAEVFAFLRERSWEDEPFSFIHPWTNRDVMIGHGSIGLEIVGDMPAVDTVYIPVGGGGLASGVGFAVKSLRPEVRVVAVEPEGCPALHESFRQGRPARVECRTICDGVAVPYITEEMYPLLREVVDDVVLVSEAAIRGTIRRLALRDRLIVEASAALSVAAALATPRTERGRTVCLVTGGSIDTKLLIEILRPD
jgi:threonine dehydratase